MTKMKSAAVLVCLACATGAYAAERKAYKYVDEKGNVTYSQTPPADKEAKTVDMTPAHRGRGGYASREPVTPTQPGWNGDRQSQASSEQLRRRDEAQKKRLAQLEAECDRSRGTDCKNPETLRYMEAQRIPNRR